MKGWNHKAWLAMTALIFGMGILASGCSSRASELSNLCDDWCEKVNECSDGLQLNCSNACATWDNGQMNAAAKHISDACYNSALTLYDCYLGLTCEELDESADEPGSPCYNEQEAAEHACDGEDPYGDDDDDDDDFIKDLSKNNPEWKQACMASCENELACGGEDKTTYFEATGGNCESYCTTMSAAIAGMNMIQGGDKCADRYTDLLQCQSKASCESLDEYGLSDLPSCQDAEAKRLEACDFGY